MWTGLLLLIVTVAFGCWLGVRALDAKASLEQARHSAQQAKEALLQGHTDEAAHWADSAQSHAQAARTAAHSLPWNIVAAVPWLGRPFETRQQITDVVVGLATEVLQPSARIGVALSPDRSLQAGRVDVQLLREEFQIRRIFRHCAVPAPNYRSRRPSGWPARPCASTSGC